MEITNFLGMSEVHLEAPKALLGSNFMQKSPGQRSANSEVSGPAYIVSFCDYKRTLLHLNEERFIWLTYLGHSPSLRAWGRNLEHKSLRNTVAALLPASHSGSFLI